MFLRDGDAMSIRNAVWEKLEDSKCFELILLLRYLEFSLRNAYNNIINSLIFKAL